MIPIAAGKKLPVYRVETTCHVCGKKFLSRYNVGRRAKVCTPRDHVCEPLKKTSPNGATRIMACLVSCCRSRYQKISAASMDTAIDKRKLLSKDEFALVAGAMQKLEDPVRIGLRFVAGTGCRLGEAMLVRGKDLGLDEIPPSIHVPTLKRSGRPVRTVHLHDRAFVRELRLWADKLDPEERLFPCSRRSLQRWLRRLLDRLGLAKDSLTHLLRHTRASQLSAAGFDVNYIRGQLGWSSVEMARIYMHVEEDRMREIGKRLPTLGKGSGTKTK